MSNSVNRFDFFDIKNIKTFYFEQECLDDYSFVYYEHEFFFEELEYLWIGPVLFSLISDSLMKITRSL